MTNENREISKKAVEIWTTKDFDQLYELYDHDCIQHQQKLNKNFDIFGIEAWKKYVQEFLIQYPDYQEKVIFQIAESDKVVTILDCHALNVSWSGTITDHIVNHRIHETWVWFKRLS